MQPFILLILKPKVKLTGAKAVVDAINSRVIQLVSQ